MGLTTALIYTPATFATTEEPIELAKVASQAGGMYISHMRSEGNRLLEAIDEVITIAKQANIRAEIYHLKAGDGPTGASSTPRSRRSRRRVRAPSN
jgi:N-acyl-D-amino-acid deacylase